MQEIQGQGQGAPSLTELESISSDPYSQLILSLLSPVLAKILQESPTFDT